MYVTIGYKDMCVNGIIVNIVFWIFQLKKIKTTEQFYI